MVAIGAALMAHASNMGPPGPATPHHVEHAEDLAAARQPDFAVLAKSGDAQAQRGRVWGLIAQLTRTATAQGQPPFESWHGEGEVFASTSVGRSMRGIRGFSRVTPDRGNRAAADLHIQSADTPILTYTLYNDAAANHIRRNRLNRRAELEWLRNRGDLDPSIRDDRSVPSFPADAIVLKTAWWPVAQSDVTALPVWDPELNPPRRAGNGYIGWARVVAVDLRRRSSRDSSEAIDFGGRSFPQARRVGLEAFYHVVVDARLAERTMRDRTAKKAALIALGRPLKAGDYLVLVAANMAVHEIEDWVWAAFWWHDRSEQGPFAAGRPPELKSEWRNYLMQSAFDSDEPLADDGGPHVCFNPWLEGRFPDGGHGGGTLSNCMTCHRRASYPAIRFLPVTRGAPDLANDPAYSAGRLRTSFLWSIALHARQ